MTRSKKPSFKDNYLGWRRQPKGSGCTFARVIALKPENYGQEFATFPGKDSKELARLIDEQVSKFVADPNVTAGVILLPDLKVDPEPLARMALELGTYSGWDVTTRKLPPSTPGSPLVAFGVVRQIPSGPTSSPSGPPSYPSEALIAGPFDDFPPTRLAPVTAMEIFVGSPLARDPKTGGVPTKANLAHIKLPGINDDMHQTWWLKSVADRARVLGVDDDRARAKVSFVVPMALATRLGCQPQP